MWLLVGNGEERVLIEAEVNRQQLHNVRILPLQPAEGLAEMYSAADVLLLNQKAAMEDAVIPSKLLTYMAAGRAVIAAVSERSEAARQVRGARCGLIVPAEDPAALTAAVLTLRESVAAREEFGRNGRVCAERNFTKQKVVEEYEIVFDCTSRPGNTEIQEELAAR
jgi:colanic acid biosynthesis glycosyl transferase WcaI